MTAKPLARLLGLLFPPKCVFCGHVLGQGETHVCRACMDDVLLDESAHSVRKGEFFSVAVSALRYEGNVRKALHRFKFNGRQSYAVPFAMILDFAAGQKLSKPFDCIVAVPTNRKNMRERGYNHAELLGRELSLLCGAPFIDALEKCRETEPMSGLGAARRRANVLGSIRVARGVDEIKGKSVLLVDDIITTGSTLAECSRMLLEVGAGEICCVAVASSAPAREVNKK